MTTDGAATNEHEWRHPGASEHRSPCPALNALANGGYMPRDGVTTKDEIVDAVSRGLGVAPSVGSLLAKIALRRLGKPREDGARVLDLADLALHGFIEHDASLTRRDARFGDASQLVRPLLAQLLATSRDGRRLTLDDLAVAHQLRLAQSARRGSRVPLKAAILGTLEAALLYRVLGRYGGVALADVEELFGTERIPAHIEPRKTTLAQVLLTAVHLTVVGNVPLFSAARRARNAARQIPDPEAT
jgi:hypothetical protein